MNVTKWIAKKLMPSPDKLAKIAAERLAVMTPIWSLVVVWLTKKMGI